jgi:hypothetical protein
MQFAHAQTFEWAHKFGTNGIPESVNALVTDNEGNYYVAGIVSGTFTYASSNNHIAYFGDTTVSINGADDIFIAKYSSNGNLKWAKTFGGDYDWNPSNQNAQIKNEFIYNLIYNHEQGSLFFSGVTVGVASFDGHLISNQSGVKTSFISKLDLNGNCIWATPIGTSDADCKINLSNYKSSIIVSGILFNPGPIGNYMTQNGGFIAKLNSNNVFDYASCITSGYVKEIKFQDNYLYVFGEFAGVDTLRFDSIHLNFPNHRSGFFISKLDTNFNMKWMKHGSSDSYITSLNAMNVDNLGSAYFKLGTSGTLFFENDTLIYNSNQHVYLAEIDSSGLTKQINKLKTPFIYDITKDVNHNFNFIGALSGSDSTCTNDIHYSSQNRDVLIANLDSSFYCSNYFHWGYGVGYKAIYNIDGSIIVLGIIGSPGSDCSNCSSTLNLGNISLTSAGSTDGFIAKFNGFTSGIDDRSRKVNTTNESLLIYANPSNGVCDVEIPEAFIHEKEVTLNIYSNTGVLIQQVKVDMSEAVIKVDIQQQAKGMYTATLSNGSKLYKGRIVFE